LNKAVSKANCDDEYLGVRAIALRGIYEPWFGIVLATMTGFPFLVELQSKQTEMQSDNEVLTLLPVPNPAPFEVGRR
jgi:hypothetical protein